ncbi:MAG TPA: deaminase [Solirubrobacteraceae bacterium]|jgi:dCMP deaminase
MSEDCVLAYIPVLHEGYRRFLQRHGHDRRLFVVGPELYAEYRPLAKDIRALPAALLASAVGSWGICSSVAVLDEQGAHALAAAGPRITMPAEDVSYQLAERFFARCDVRFDTVFLRWDKTRTAQLLEVQPQRTVSSEEAFAELALAAESAAQGSVDWWRRVGAAIRFADGSLHATHNVHNPHPLSAYAAGDPRSNFYKGVALELSTATHAEARLIAQAARAGLPTRDATLYVTDFPCPPCAKLIAAAGITKLYYRQGYAVLDGQDVLAAAGVEIVQVRDSAEPGSALAGAPG